MTTTVTANGGEGDPEHTIKMKGLAGAIFACIGFATLFDVVAFATTSWSVKFLSDTADSRLQVGLWESCNCTDNGNMIQPWGRAVQAMINIGLILMLLGILVLLIYMCLHFISKNVILIILTVLCFTAAVFTMIGLAVFGAKSRQEQFQLSWSFAFSAASAILCALTGLLSLIQMKKSGMC